MALLRPGPLVRKGPYGLIKKAHTAHFWVLASLVGFRPHHYGLDAIRVQGFRNVQEFQMLKNSKLVDFGGNFQSLDRICFGKWVQNKQLNQLKTEMTQ